MPVNTRVIGSIPQTLKFTQISSGCVLQTHSFKIARKEKIHPSFSLIIPNQYQLDAIDLPIIFLRTGSFVKYFPKYKARANKILMIVGFT